MAVGQTCACAGPSLQRGLGHSVTLGTPSTREAATSRGVCRRGIWPKPRGQLLRTHTRQLRQDHRLSNLRQAGQCYLIETPNDGFWAASPGMSMSASGRPQLLGRRRRRAGMLRIAVRRGSTASRSAWSPEPKTRFGSDADVLRWPLSRRSNRVENVRSCSISRTPRLPTLPTSLAATALDARVIRWSLTQKRRPQAGLRASMRLRWHFQTGIRRTTKDCRICRSHRLTERRPTSHHFLAGTTASSSTRTRRLLTNPAWAMLAMTC